MKGSLAFTLILLAGCSGGQMATSVSTHLMFQGAAGEAIELYQSVFPEFVVQRQELHEDGDAVGKVRLAYVRFADHDLIIFDSPPVHNFTFTPAMSLFVDFDDADRLRRAFETLSEGGEVPMPLDNYGFSPLFGWVQDRHGVSWQLNLKGEGQ
jgi:predicted 3-demethylubiquinone-9 3-methyltransferase (glyoxalase superfamily)